MGCPAGTAVANTPLPCGVGYIFILFVRKKARYILKDIFILFVRKNQQKRTGGERKERDSGHAPKWGGFRAHVGILQFSPRPSGVRPSLPRPRSTDRPATVRGRSGAFLDSPPLDRFSRSTRRRHTHPRSVLEEVPASRRGLTGQRGSRVIPGLRRRDCCFETPAVEEGLSTERGKHPPSLHPSQVVRRGTAGEGPLSAVPSYRRGPSEKNGD